MSEIAEEKDTTYEYELEMQQKFVALLFQDFTYLSTVGIELIKPSYFDNVYLRNIAKWIINYYEQYHTKPTESVLLTELSNYSSRVLMPTSEQETFAMFIRQLSTLVIEDSQYVKDQALEFARSVAMREAISKLVDMYDKSQDYEKAISIVDEALSVGAGSNLGMSLMDNIDVLPQQLKDSYDPTQLFLTNLPTLDDAFGGGMAKGELFVFAGAPGRGKSKFLSYLAYQAIFQKKPVVYFTFEWSEKEVLSNIVSCATGMTMRDLLDEAQIDKYKMRVQKLKMFSPQVRTIYYSNKTVSANHLRTYLTKLHSLENFDPGLIIVDYADLMLPNKQTRRSSESTYEEMGTIFYDLKALADQFKCPVVTGSQLGKAAWSMEDNAVSSQDQLADSSRKAHVAYGIVTLNQTREELDVGKMRLYVAKARRGKTNTTIYLDFDKARNQIHECAEYDVKEFKKDAKGGK